MLPAEKGDGPKCLYLDTNKWIDLAKAHYGRPGGEPFQETLSIIRRAVQSGQLVVPFSLVQSIEAAKSREPGRRERLIRFMVDLSGNKVFRCYLAIQRLEVRNAVRLLMGHRPTTPIRTQVVGRGLLDLYGKVRVTGGSQAAQTELLAMIGQPSTTIESLLADGAKRSLLETLNMGEKQGLAELRAIRQRAESSLSRDQCYVVNLMSFLRDPEMWGETLREVFRSELVDLAAFQARLCDSRETVLRFGHSIPTFHASISLGLGQPRSRATQQNDTRDLIWLMVALPYADAVVMEKTWANVIWSEKLDKEFGTRVITDTADIPRLLGELGCTI